MDRDPLGERGDARHDHAPRLPERRPTPGRVARPGGAPARSAPQRDAPRRPQRDRRRPSSTLERRGEVAGLLIARGMTTRSERSPDATAKHPRPPRPCQHQLSRQAPPRRAARGQPRARRGHRGRSLRRSRSPLGHRRPRRRRGSVSSRTRRRAPGSRAWSGGDRRVDAVGEGGLDERDAATSRRPPRREARRSPQDPIGQVAALLGRGRPIPSRTRGKAAPPEPGMHRAQAVVAAVPTADLAAHVAERQVELVVDDQHLGAAICRLPAAGPTASPERFM